MHASKTKAYSFYVKNFLATNLILINDLSKSTYIKQVQLLTENQIFFQSEATQEK